MWKWREVPDGFNKIWKVTGVFWTKKDDKNIFLRRYYAMLIKKKEITINRMAFLLCVYY